MVLAAGGSFTQDHTSLMETTSKLNEILRANIKAAKQFSEYSWITDSVSEVQMALARRIYQIFPVHFQQHNPLRYICFAFTIYFFKDSHNRYPDCKGLIFHSTH